LHFFDLTSTLLLYDEKIGEERREWIVPSFGPRDISGFEVDDSFCGIPGLIQGRQ
jgi:hypothetical protein